MADFEISVKTDFTEVKKALKGAQDNALKAAAAASLNRSVAAGKTEAVKQLKSYRALPSTEIRSLCNVHKANYNSLIASLVISHSSVRLGHYKVHNTVRGGGPISVQVDPHNGYKPLYNAFVGKGGRLPAGVIFERQRPWHPVKLKSLPGPSVSSAANKSVVADAIKNKIDMTWDQTFKAQLKWRLEKLGFSVS